MVHKQILLRKCWPADELLLLSMLFREKYRMYNMSALREEKKMLIITFGTLTNYGTFQELFRRRGSGEGWK